MGDEFRTAFLTYYIHSLGKRTREEKRGTKFGFDWIIYNLALAEDWTPHRLPFLRSGDSEISTAKTEPEFGVDLAFLSPDQQTLRIFVLKDEVLNNANWTRENFDIDLRNASAPDLSRPELQSVTQVEVILAYNKDEDRTGVEHFDRRVAQLGTRVGDHVSLRFDRWNLTAIVGRVQASLLTPSLLPQRFFSHFSYICAQFADFRHGSDEWTRQLIPNWRRFLESLLAENADERCVRLLPVALLILWEHGRNNPTVETAWIDLIEWGMLAAWRVVQMAPKKTSIGQAVWQMWNGFYVAELERYYGAHAGDLRVRHSLDVRLSGSLVDAIASAVVAHWHVARLGILGFAYAECLPNATADEARQRQKASIHVSNWLLGLLNANPSALRPLIDLHHIELFLTWACLLRANRIPDMVTWLTVLCNRLLMRRSGLGQLPFLEGGNVTKLVFEHVAGGEKPDEFCDTSSVYLTCLLEMTCVLPREERNRLLETVYRRLALGRADCGTPMDRCQPIDLMAWIPPTDWGERVLTQSLQEEGECTAIYFAGFDGTEPATGDEIADRLATLIAETRKKREFRYADGLPMALVVLACSKHHSPLPPEFWRAVVFSNKTEPQCG
jgi:hypothetical protein